MKPLSRTVFPLFLCLYLPVQAQKPTITTGTFKEILPQVIKASYSGFEGMYYLDTNDYNNKLVLEIKDPLQKEQFELSTDDNKKTAYIREQFKTMAAAKAKRESWKKILMGACPGYDFIELENFPEPYYVFKHPAMEYWNITLDVLDRRETNAKGQMITTYSAGLRIEETEGPWPGEAKPLNAFQQTVRSVTMQFNYYSQLSTDLYQGKPAWMAKNKMVADVNSMTDVTNMDNWLYTAVWNTRTQEAADAKWKTLSEEVTEALQSFMKKEDCSSDGSKCLKFTRKEEGDFHATVVTIEQVVDADLNQVNVYFMVR